jgi:O-succinylbenzoate synthase
MKIERAELIDLSVRLRFRFETSFGVEQQMSKMLLVLHADGLEGYGELTANHFPGYSYETTGGAWLTLTDHLLPLLLGREVATPAQLLELFGHVRGHNMAVAAIETALWDLQAKAANLPLWQLLGGVRTEIPVGISIGIQPTVEQTVEAARAHLAEGYRRLKFKIKPGWDVTPLRALREVFPDTPLTVDANSAYRLTDARVFQQLDELGLDYIEQPLAHDDLHDHAELQRLLATPLCLDESIHSPADARKALAGGAGRVINVKVGRVRGHLEARRIHDVALAFGAPVWCGGMLELGVGRAHNLHLSSLENYTLPGDTSSASRYWDEDVIEERLDAVDGVQRMPEGPGLGVTLQRDAIDRFAVRRIDL